MVSEWAVALVTVIPSQLWWHTSEKNRVKQRPSRCTFICIPSLRISRYIMLLRALFQIYVILLCDLKKCCQTFGLIVHDLSILCQTSFQIGSSFELRLVSLLVVSWTPTKYYHPPYLSLSQRQMMTLKKEVLRGSISALSFNHKSSSFSPFYLISQGTQLSFCQGWGTWQQSFWEARNRHRRQTEREFEPGWEPSLSQFRGSLVDSLGALISLWKWSCSGTDVHRNLPYSPGVVIRRVTGCMGQWGQRGNKHEGSTLKFVCPAVAADGKVRL